MGLSPNTPVSTGVLLVSHSRALADAVKRLAAQMAGAAVPIHVAAGIGENGAEIGTDAGAILAALEGFDPALDIVVLMDLGSALLSTELALDLAQPALKARVTCLAAPFVEGAIAAAAAAGAGFASARVAAEAVAALAPKRMQLQAPEAAQSETETLGNQVADLNHAEVRAERAVNHPGGFSCEAIIHDPHGLHARPAAALALAAAQFKARLSLRDLDTGKGPVDMTSLIALSSLGARAGHRLEIVAEGVDSDAAAHKLAAMIEGFSGEKAAPEASADPVAANRGKPVPVSPGLALGKLVRLESPPIIIPQDKAVDPDHELRVLEDALLAERAVPVAGHAIAVLKTVFLSDPALIGRAHALIRAQSCTAPQAFARALGEAVLLYEALDDPVLRARAVDVRDAGEAVLRRLLTLPALAVPDVDQSILYVDELVPSLVATLDPARILGVVEARGGPTAHSAILLRAAGIPALCGVGVLSPLPEEIAFDGATGELILNPSMAEKQSFVARQQAERAKLHTGALTEGVVCLQDGTKLELWANVASLADARNARVAGAFGIGLLRTEVMFLERTTAPSEEEQASALKAIFDVFQNRPITVRTLDAGGDKPVPYMTMAKEANPFLGVRGLRLALREPALFLVQLRAILRAGYGHDIHIMLPMVTDVGEVLAARQFLKEAHERLKTEYLPHAWPVQLGIMVEVPAAALIADKLAAVADFFSIGTNDLTQYTLAAERGNPNLSQFADAVHPAVLRLVAMTAEAGKAKGRHVAVCGEAAGDVLAAKLFVGAGIEALSMSAGLLPRVAGALCTHTLRIFQTATAQALTMPDAKSVRDAI